MDSSSFGRDDVSEYLNTKGIATVGTTAPFQQRGVLTKFLFVLGFACAVLLVVIAAGEWYGHDISGECRVIESGEEYLYKVNNIMAVVGCYANPDSATACREHYSRTSDGRCCPAKVVADNTTCTAANGVSTMEKCIQKVCGKATPIFFGQCAAPDLAITSGVLGVVVIVGAWFSYMLPGDCLCFSTSMACTVLTCLLGITTASMSGAAFVTSFFRFGSGNIHGGNNFDLDGNTHGPDCNYTYSDTRGDYKAMTWIAFVNMIFVVGLMVNGALMSHRQALYLQQRSELNRNLESTMATQAEFM